MPKASEKPGRHAAGRADEEPATGAELALHLLNTMGPVEGASGDRLRSPDDLLGWLGARGLAGRERLDALRASPPDLALLLAEAGRLRADVARALSAFRAGEPVPSQALHGIDRVLGSSSVSTRLQADGGRMRLVDEERGEALLALLAPVARSAAKLMTALDPRRLRRCASEDCGAWFVDTSKGGRRRWCSMATCGNRAKAARHRKRRRAG